MKLTTGQRFRAFFTGKLPDPPEIKPPPIVPPKKTVVGSWNGFTLSQWQMSNEHIKWAQSMFQDTKFRDMLAVLANASPSIDERTPASYGKELGRFLGYRQLLGIIFLLPRFPEQLRPEVEADYDAEHVLASELGSITEEVPDTQSDYLEKV